MRQRNPRSLSPEQAGQDARKRLAAPFVVCEPGTTRVVGYYTLSALSIDVGELPQETARRLPGYPEMPAILLGRPAVDTSLKAARAAPRDCDQYSGLASRIFACMS